MALTRTDLLDEATATAEAYRDEGYSLTLRQPPCCMLGRQRGVLDAGVPQRRGGRPMTPGDQLWIPGMEKRRPEPVEQQPPEPEQEAEVEKAERPDPRQMKIPGV